MIALLTTLILTPAAGLILNVGGVALGAAFLLATRYSEKFGTLLGLR